MTTYVQIPLKPGTPQRLKVTLGQKQYVLRVYYANGWFVDIGDVLTGVPLVTGCDLLEQYKHLDFGGSLVVQTASDPDAVPTFDNLGEDGMLWWVQ